MSKISSNTDAVDTALAKKILEAIARQESGVALMHQGREQWAQATLDLAINLVAARDSFRANQEFSNWLEAEGIETTKDDRAALIAMGRDPERARQVLGETNKTSVRRIYNEEFRPRTPANTTKQPAKTAAQSSEENTAGSATAPAEEVVSLREENAALKKEIETLKAAASKTAEPSNSINPALAAEVLDLRKQKADLVTKLSQLQIKFDKEVQKRVDAYTKEVLGNDAAKALKLAQQRNYATFPLTEAEFKKLARCCHPDTSSDAKSRTDAMALLNDKRDALVGPPKVKGPEREYVPPEWPPASEGLEGLFAKGNAQAQEEAALRKAAKGAARH